MSKVQQIHEASMKILAETGMRFHHPDALEILRSHGVRVEGEIAFFTEEQILTWVKKAPSVVSLYAENSSYDMKIGGESRYNGPCGGSTFILERDGHLRDATMKDFVKLTMLFEQNPDYFLNGGLACQPCDIPTEFSTELIALSSMLHTGKCLFTPAGSYKTIDRLVKMACIRYGVTLEELKERPRICTIANTNSALLLDKNMTETILGFGKYGQPIIIASAAMAGTTTPVTLAGTIAVVNAEVISTIAMAQMAHPGTPVIYGSQSSNADMSTCAMAIGSPEGALCYKYCAEMARFYGVPSRGGGSLTDAKTVNVQAGYESMMIHMACKESGINLMTQSAGIVDSYLAVSYDKLMADFEIIRYVQRYLRDIEIDEETIPLELINEVGHGGSYLTEDHTIEYCRSELYTPLISVRGPQQDPEGRIYQNIDQKIAAMLRSYQKPQVTEEIREALAGLLLDEGLQQEHVDYVMNQ